jgi:hypothetical protein
MRIINNARVKYMKIKTKLRGLSPRANYTPYERAHFPLMLFCFLLWFIKPNKLRGLSPRVNSTDGETAACRRS